MVGRQKGDCSEDTNAVDKSGARTVLPREEEAGPSLATFHGSDLLVGLAPGAGLLVNRLPSYSSLILAPGSCT